MFKQVMTNDDKNLLQKGFTLVELLIVVVILGILAGVVVFAVGAFTDDAQDAACGTELTTLETAVESYKAKNADSTLAPDLADLQSAGIIKTAPTNHTVVDGVVAPTSTGKC